VERAAVDARRREPSRGGESERFRSGKIQWVSPMNHEQTGLEGATEDGSGLSARGPWVRWVRLPGPGFESSVDGRSKW
jgi:hypothetical protein